MKEAFAVVVLAIGTATMAPGQAPAPAAPASGFKADLIASIDDAGTKLVDLARAMPAEKYGWRPGEGVRSVSEVYICTSLPGTI